MASNDNSADRGFLALIFAGGLMSVVLAAALAAVGISGGIALLADRAMSFPVMLGWMFGGLAGASALMIVGVGAVVFALIGVYLLAKAKKKIAAQPSFMNTNVYRGTIYTTLVVLSVLAVAAAGSALAITLTSLIVLGGNVSIKSLYLDEFLPAIISAIVLSAAAWATLGIAKNKKGFVKALSVGLIVLSAAALILAGTAVGVKSHVKSSSSKSNSSSQQTNSSNKNSSSSSNKNSNKNNSSSSSCDRERQTYIDSGDSDDYEEYYDCLMDYYTNN